MLTEVYELTDTHCHIQTADINWQADDFTRSKWLAGGKNSPLPIINAAQAAGVKRLICVGTTLPDSQQAVRLANANNNVWASAGLHPHEATQYVAQPESLEQFSALATEPRVIAIGECGLDYFYEHSKKADQATILRFQIELALSHDLPIIFHVREAFEDFWSIFDSYRGIRGVLHSFTDDLTNLEKALEHNLYIGVNGISTFAKAEAQIAMYKAIPLQHLLLETDAPFLTPHPYRGTICEPSHMVVTANFLSELKNIPLEELAATTTRNAAQLFNLR